MIYTIVIIDENERVRETISLDVVNDFSEDYDGSVPTHPVEHGYSLSDGINLSNDKFSISGVVSDSAFDLSGELIQFVNGEFIVPDNTVDGVVLDSPSLVFKERLKSIRTRKEHFGVIVSDKKVNVNDASASQIELIYPCIITKLGFKDNGTDAVYPVINFERVRVATTSFVEVNNPTPELIPYAKDAINVGDKTGTSSSASGATDSSIAEAKKLEEKFGQAPSKDNSAEVYDRIRSDEIKETAKVQAEATQKLSNGTLTKDSAQSWVEQEVNRRMISKHGIAWKARLKP